MNKILKALLDNGYTTLITDINGKELFKDSSYGVRDLNFIFHKKAEFLNNSIVYKDVVGGANAIFSILGKVNKVVCDIISEIALEKFKFYGVNVEYNHVIPYLKNIKQTDICPIENASSSSINLEKSLEAVEKAILEIKKNTSCSIR